MVLKLRPEHFQSLSTHAEIIYPDECCGILVGEIVDKCKTVMDVLQTQNIWNAETATDYPDKERVTQKARRYAIAPRDLLEAQKSARSRHLDIIGFYHSHPDYPAIPSEFDRACAWEQYSYIIVSVQQGKASELSSWCLDSERQFQSEEIRTLD